MMHDLDVAALHKLYKAAQEEPLDDNVLDNARNAFDAVLGRMAAMVSKVSPMPPSYASRVANDIQMPGKIYDLDNSTSLSNSWSWSTVVGGAALLMAMRGSRLGSAKC